MFFTAHLKDLRTNGVVRRHAHGLIAQLVEHIAHNDKDTGSNPVETTKKYVLEMIYSTESPAPQRGVDIIIVKGRMICWQSTVKD